MTEPRKQHNSIDEYIADFPKEVQEIMEKLRKLIHELAPDIEEGMNYQIPTFRLKKKNLVHFAAFQKHIGFYPTPSGIEMFKEQLSKYKSSKGSVQFPLNEPIPYNLVREITEFRIKEVKEKVKK